MNRWRPWLIWLVCCHGFFVLLHLGVFFHVLEIELPLLVFSLLKCIVLLLLLLLLLLIIIIISRL